MSDFKAKFGGQAIIWGRRLNLGAWPRVGGACAPPAPSVEPPLKSSRLEDHKYSNDSDWPHRRRRTRRSIVHATVLFGDDMTRPECG